ncbi:MAG: glycine--tRNA ligase subunit beta, partial [Mariprofundaceae bacterium]|nr:glycine--tRNA ligase subunit beta [Mariprofundaceae bacterium]
MSQTAPLLIEIGVEEMPAFVAPKLGAALESEIHMLLQSAHIDVHGMERGVTPRRLLIHMNKCPVMQPDREETVWGPPEHVAYADGKPTRAAEGFARKSGITLEDFTLADKGDGKTKYMRATRKVRGRRVTDILAEAMPDILRGLPGPKQMKWVDGESRADAFIRPVRWIVARLGNDLISFEYAGVKSGKISHGHRVHGSGGEIDVKAPFKWLEKAYVIANRNRRMSVIREQLEAAAKA